MSRHTEKSLSKKFIDTYIYSLYKALYMKLGDDAWDIVWNSGKIFYEEYKDRISIKEDDTPENIIDKVGRFFTEVGYIDRLEVNKVNQDLIEFTIYHPIPWNANVKLRKEGMVPGQILIPVLVAALESRGYTVTMLKDREFGDRRLTERWKISKPKKT